MALLRAVRKKSIAKQLRRHPGTTTTTAVGAARLLLLRLSVCSSAAIAFFLVGILGLGGAGLQRAEGADVAGSVARNPPVAEGSKTAGSGSNIITITSENAAQTVSNILPPCRANMSGFESVALLRCCSAVHWPVYASPP